MDAEPYAPKTNEGNNRGSEGKDDTCDRGLYVQKVKSRSVSKQEKKITRRDGQLVISSNKEHVKYEAYKIICRLRTNTRPLALDRQRTIAATESGTIATTAKQAI